MTRWKLPLWTTASVLGLVALATLLSSCAPAAETEQGQLAVSAQFTEAKADEPAQLFIVAEIEEGWHTFSITQARGGPRPTKITLAPSDQFRLLEKSFTASPPPETHYSDIWPGLALEEHTGRVVWHVPIEIAKGVDTRKLKIAGKVSAQRCDKDTCLPPKNFEFTATLGEGINIGSDQRAVAVPPGGVSDGTAQSGGSAPPQPPVSRTEMHAAAAVVPGGLDEASLRKHVAAEKPASLALMLVFGFLGGAILNLMPCVLPVIGLKIMSFVQQGGHNRRHVLLLNIWYSLGLMSVFMVLAVLAHLLGFGWGELFRYREFNIALAGIVFVMGLSFLGVWEIPIPGFVGSGKAGELATHEGPAGAFAKGALTTVLATPCTGPFLGPALVFAVRQPPHIIYLVFACVGLGMASPYLVLGAFPGLVRLLPKPGAWMETFKQVMGFVLFGTVVYLFTYIHWKHLVPTIALLAGLGAACWWVGRTPLTAELGAKVRAWCGAATFAMVAGLAAFHWLGPVMANRFQVDVEAQIVKLKTDGPAARTANGHELPWQPYSWQTLDRLVREDKTVLVDFTADWCPTCKTLEALVLNTSETRQKIDTNQVVTLVADWTDYEDDVEVSRMLDILGAKQVPTLAIFPAGHPNEPIVVQGGYTKGHLLDLLTQAGPSKEGPSATSTAMDK